MKANKNGYSYMSLRAKRGNPCCEPFASCHSEPVSRSPEQSEGEESHIAQGRLREAISTEIASSLELLAMTLGLMV